MNTYVQETDSKTAWSRQVYSESSGETLADRPNIWLTLGPGDSSFVEAALSVVCTAADHSVQQQASALLRTLFKALEALLDVGIPLDHIPPLRATATSDDSVLFEWIQPDFRVGFSIEPDASNSSWYVVTNERLREYSASGQLGDRASIGVVLPLIVFVLMNS